MSITFDQLVFSMKKGLLEKYTDSYDLLNIANLDAAFDSARYLNANMSAAKNLNSDLELLSFAMASRAVDGMILEFGVASGRTINHLASLTKEIIYGFDVFTGLPETWRTGFEKGAFSRNDLPEVAANVELIVGLFEDGIDRFLTSQTSSSPISLLHVDCDLYAGTKTIFQKIGHLLTKGSVIVFDEYFNYPGWQHHEFKAFKEFIKHSGLAYEYAAFVSRHQQVCVVIL